MNPPRKKTLDDFPKFVVTAVRRLGISASGEHCFELEGRYDPVLEEDLDWTFQGNGPTWFWLMSADRRALCPTLEHLDKETKTAILDCQENEEPEAPGWELAYLGCRWDARQLWMVLDPNWGWKRNQYSEGDAVAQDYEADEVTIIDGREIKVWTKVEPIEGGGQSQHYPAENQALPVDTTPRRITNAWSHDHCQLCDESIEPGMVGYSDPNLSWMCEKCYEKYVVPCDLAFVDEL